MEVKVSKRADTIPAQKAAGADQVPYENLNIFHDFIKNERPPTPENIQRFRKSFQNAPGHRFVNRKAKDDDIPDARFGVKSDYGVRVSDALEPLNQPGFATFMNEERERIYLSNQREPLGKGFSRNHAFPEHVQDEKFRFGIKSDTDVGAKGLIYAHSGHTETQREIMQRTKNSNKVDLRASFTSERDVSQAHHRNYDWKDIDPETHRFGKVLIRNEQYGVRDALSFEEPKTTVGSKRFVQMKDARGDPLGRARNPRGNLRNLPETHTFGHASQRDSWGAKRCIRGDYDVQDQLPDKDLGKTGYTHSRILRKVRQKDGIDPNRRHGLPSLRSDVPAPAFRSVADTHNYGDEQDAKALLNPSKYAYDGVVVEDFTASREEQEIRAIFDSAGMHCDDQQFAQCVQVAAQLTGGALTVDSFRNAFNKVVLHMT